VLGAAAQRVGQLGIAFGGFEGIAARITPATAAIGGLAAAAGALALAYKQGKDESDAYAKAIILSGNAAVGNISQKSFCVKVIS
jgi:phage-related minor tail protein